MKSFRLFLVLVACGIIVCSYGQTSNSTKFFGVSVTHFVEGSSSFTSSLSGYVLIINYNNKGFPSSFVKRDNLGGEKSYTIGEYLGKNDKGYQVYKYEGEKSRAEYQICIKGKESAYIYEKDQQTLGCLHGILTFSSNPSTNDFGNNNSAGSGVIVAPRNQKGENNSSNSSVYTKCNTCLGSGICPRCKGSRGQWEYVDSYTGSGAKKWINCVSCNGSGKCSICYGRGKL